MTKKKETFKRKTITVDKEQLEEIIEQAYRYGFNEGEKAAHEQVNDIKAIIIDVEEIHGKL
jgi:hypothetical protein